MKKILLVISFILCLTFLSNDSVTAQTTTILEPGDIAIVQFNSDSDFFSFVVFKPIMPDTEIKFTDYGWDAGEPPETGHFDMQFDEGILAWTNSTNDIIPTGSIITITNMSPMNLSTSGDQIFVYQGIIDQNPTILFGINFSGSTATWQGSASSATTSARPPSLDDSNSLAVVGLDNGIYNTELIPAITAGTAEDLMVAIVNSGNWLTSNNSITQTLPDSFSISPTSINLITINGGSTSLFKLPVFILAILFFALIILLINQKHKWLSKIS